MAKGVIVVTADQRGSSTGPDRVEALLDELNGDELAPHRVLVFERTAGDEVQGVLSDADVAVDLALRLARTGHWSTGLGAGSVNRPLPASTRAARGEAFQLAREAVERAKSVRERVAVSGADAEVAGDAEAVLQVLAAIDGRRSAAGREVVRLVAAGASQNEAAEALGVSKQAVSQRLHAALWGHEVRLRPLAARLLEAAGRRSRQDT